MDLHEFENLNAAEQEKVFHKSSFRDKSELLMHAHNPGALTRSLSQEEFYLLTRDLDSEERGELIRHATLPQLFFVSDIDCWKRDRLDGRSFVKWLETLLAAGEDKLLTWLSEMDYEAIITGYQQVMQVIKPDHEWTTDDIMGDTPYFTIDSMYHIFVSEENLEAIKRSLEILFENRRGRYIAILEGVLGELTDQAEEDAYQRREIRLAERGFPDYESAQQIYRPLTRDEFEKFPRKTETAPSKDVDRGVTPNYMVLWSETRLFLDDVLHSYQDDTTGMREKLQEELAWISNKVIACDGIDYSNEKKVKKGIERARGFINIGLEQLSGRNIPAARIFLEERWLEIIFRWGVSQTSGLRDQAKALLKRYWKSEQVGLLSFLDAPYDSIYAGLIRPIPECFEFTSDNQEPLRDFKTLEDIDRSQKALLQLEAVHKMLAKEFPKDFESIIKQSGREDSKLTFFGFLGTLFANQILKGKPVFKPMDLTVLSEFVNLGFEDKTAGRVLKSNLKEQFTGFLFEPADRELCFPLLALFFSRIEQEWGKVKPGSVPNDLALIVTPASADKKQAPKARRKSKSS